VQVRLIEFVTKHWRSQWHPQFSGLTQTTRAPDATAGLPALSYRAGGYTLADKLLVAPFLDGLRIHWVDLQETVPAISMANVC
tara:strand:+ start:163 stop:411 length:249 start_codon:yes stop_codon:yes gene_type:complete